MVTNDQGYPICEFENFRLRKAVSGASSKQMSALGLTAEPFRIPPTIVAESRFFRTQNEQAYERLYRALDYLAVRKLQQTLKRRLPCGNSVSPNIDTHSHTYVSLQADRIRYIQKLTEVAQYKIVSPIPEESELREQELRWPAFFEVTRRVEGAHESNV